MSFGCRDSKKREQIFLALLTLIIEVNNKESIGKRGFLILGLWGLGPITRWGLTFFGVVCLSHDCVRIDL